MKTNKTLEHLQIALSAMPQNFNLSRARTLIRTAIDEIHHIEGKNTKREQINAAEAERHRLKIADAVHNSLNPADSLKAIEKMMEMERLKQEEKKSQQQQQKPHTSSNDTVLND